MFHLEMADAFWDQGFHLRPLTLEDFFASDGTSHLPPSDSDDHELAS